MIDRTQPSPLRRFAVEGFVSAVALVGGLAFTGCTQCRTVSIISQPSLYSRVTTSDFEGRCMAEYIAEGSVVETKGGFIFRALERRIFHPSPLVFRYPLGRSVVAVASNVVVEPSPCPPWVR